MELLTILKLAPLVLSAVEVVKRFIPNEKRNVANPILAVVAGLLGAYTVGGQREFLEVLTQGGLAAAAAIGAYKVPKSIGEKLGIE